MKIFILLLALGVSCSALSQSNTFPEGWVGNWKGELEWYKTGKAEPEKVNMELRIQSTDSGNNYTWQIIYGSATEDSRPYILIPKNTANGHWVIDENNGIVLDQYWVGNRFCGAFTVMGNTIVNNYWLENDRLMVEFFSFAAKAVVTTGKGTEESPSVDSFQIRSYQKAILKRVQ